MEVVKIRIRKRLIAGLLLGGLLLSASMSAAAANSNSVLHTWSGNVGFGDVKVGSAYKTDPSNTTYLSFNGAPEYVKVWLTTRNSSGVLTSAKALLNLGSLKYVPTGAARGQRVDLFASREHWGDAVFAMNGSWRP